MPGRSRRSGGRGRGRRGGPDVGALMWRAFFWRTFVGQVWLFWQACTAFPMVTFAVLTWLTILIQSGSFWVATFAAPALFGVGAYLWFRYRVARTGLSMKEAAAQLRRERRVRRQWPLACDRAGWGVVPDLRWRPWRRDAVTSVGDTVVVRFNAAGAGLDQAPILSGLESMAQVVAGGCRNARMKALGHSGLVEVRFAWGDSLGNLIRPNDIPAAPRGMAACGLSDNGSVVGFQILNSRGECVLVPSLITGMSGSGKSSTGWALLMGFIKDRIPVKVWVADPAGGVELGALEDALSNGDRSDTFQVVHYADTQAGIKAMVKDFHAQMMERAATAKAKRQVAHVPTIAEPINLLIIDEMLWCSELIKEGKDGPLGQVMTGGRKVAFTVLAFAQTAKVSDLGALRDLFLLRVVMKVMTREGVEAALGSGAGWAERAPAHRLSRSQRGVGFMVDAEGLGDVGADEAVRFRSVFLEKEQREAIARGEMPSGVERFAREEVDPQAFSHCLYRYFDARMELLYVGETNNWERRHREHMRKAPWRGQVVEDSEHIVRAWFHGSTPQDAEAQAKAAESYAIKSEAPLFNDKENERNPLRVAREKVGV